jgi:hypothetical protein
MKGQIRERELIPEGLIQCGECGAYALAGDRFCSCCGTSLFDRHDRAGEEEPSGNFCSSCGHRLAPEQNGKNAFQRLTTPWRADGTGRTERSGFLPNRDDMAERGSASAASSR